MIVVIRCALWLVMIKEVKHESNLTFQTHRLLIFERKQRGSIWIIRLSSSAKVTHNYAMIVRRLQSLKISFNQQFDFGQQPVFFVIWLQEEHGQTDSVQNGCHGQRDGGGGEEYTLGKPEQIVMFTPRYTMHVIRYTLNIWNMN